jgi:hypothetical protein
MDAMDREIKRLYIENDNLKLELKELKTKKGDTAASK